MIKKISIFISVIISLFFLILIYLSIFGFETNKFNKIISEKIKKSYPEINIKFKELKFLLKPISLKINVVTKDSWIEQNKNIIKFKKISTNYNIVSFFNKDFGIRNLNFESEYNNFGDLVKLARSLRDSPQLLILEKISKNGEIYINAKINLDQDGNIKKNYLISGEIKDLSVDLLNKEKLENINLKFKHKKNNTKLQEINLKYSNLEILSEAINFDKKNSEFIVTGNIKNKNAKIKDELIIKYLNFLNLKNVIFSSSSNFSFNISKKYKIKNFKIASEIDLENAEYKIDNKNFKKFLPGIENLIKLKNNKLKLTYDKNLSLSGKGELNLSNVNEIIEYDIKQNNRITNVNIDLSLKETPVKFKLLDFYKNEKTDGKITIKLKKNKKNIILNKLSFSSEKNKFDITNLKLSNKSKIIDFERIKFNFISKNNIFNDLYIVKQNDFYTVEGNNFSLSSIIGNILTGDNDSNIKIFSDKIRVFKIKFKENNIDKDHIIYNLSGEVIVDSNNINKLRLNSEFKKNEKVSLSINNKNGNQVTTFYSDLAKPFVKKFKFIKGFEEGKINYSSTKIKNKSNSQLNIYDFKLKELPALTKLLTLASLQGISDTLTGEGVHFNEFEMIFSNEDSLMTIKEVYSIGPAISVLMEGYIQKKQLISLRGTLVPATTLNKFVSSIPLIGNILVGKKTGEGVFGVSFKIKGTPKNLKTTVNPIKTLTPRFITRTLEKVKKTNE